MSFRLGFPKRPVAGSRQDLIIVGAGPAGLSAALYAARLGLKALVIGEEIGGTLIDAGLVDDYLGIQNISGPDLAKRFESHVRRYGINILRDKATEVKKEGNMFTVKTLSGYSYISKSIILAVGSKRRKLGVPGEEEYAGRGVSYCAPCDAPLFKGKVTAVVGGGNAALQAALLMTSYSPKVYLIHRRSTFRAFPFYIEKVKKEPKVELILNSQVKRIGGDKNVKWLEIHDNMSNDGKVLEVEGIIVEIGSVPPKDFFLSIGLKVDERGYLIVGPGQETNIPGIYAAGDCTSGPHKKKFDQIITAVAEGAIAALSAYEYLTLKRAELPY